MRIHIIRIVQKVKYVLNEISKIQAICTLYKMILVFLMENSRCLHAAKNETDWKKMAKIPIMRILPEGEDEEGGDAGASWGETKGFCSFSMDLGFFGVLGWEMGSLRGDDGGRKEKETEGAKKN